MVTRISGMASGMDIDTMVKGMMDAQRVPVDKLNQKKTYTQWQRDDYRTMNTAISEFDTLIFNGIGMQKSFSTKTVTVSQPDAVSVKSVSATSDFSGTVNISNLASAATMVSTASNTNIKSATQKLTEINSSLVGQTIKVKAINKDGGFDQVTKTDGSGTEDKVFTYTITENDTVQSVIDKINADSGVSVFFDEGSQRFSITAKNTGDAKVTATNGNGAEIQLDGALFTSVMNMSTDNVTAAAAYTDMKDSNNNFIKAGTAGTNASLTYNGLAIERASNTFTINGAEITVKQKTTNPVSFSSSADVDTIYNTIKSFVDSYNKLITNISDKVTEKKDANYLPLTDAQKKSMTADQITQWETAAKKGTLHNDTTLSSLLTRMRSSISSSVSNTSFGNLGKIGISTTSNYLDGGKLQIDEATLRAAISKDPNGIYNLFMSGGDATDESGKGVARRLRDNLKSAMTDISTKAGKTSSVNNTFTLGRLLDDYTSKITSMNTRLTALETRYYKQFTAMDQAVQQANNQSANLSNFLAKN